MMSRFDTIVTTGMWICNLLLSILLVGRIFSSNPAVSTGLDVISVFISLLTSLASIAMALNAVEVLWTMYRLKGRGEDEPSAWERALLEPESSPRFMAGPSQSELLDIPMKSMATAAAIATAPAADSTAAGEPKNAAGVADTASITRSGSGSVKKTPPEAAVTLDAPPPPPPPPPPPRPATAAADDDLDAFLAAALSGDAAVSPRAPREQPSIDLSMADDDIELPHV